ncbi:dihydrofolate reductase family protein [Phenylobacterium montanum]|uniref:Dihydrofolate reductase family protein n=1 Tax=Phenylobacterium montanum TaxID=2823693 RepID=A0A975FWY1_9CAUL|nr:dihydrofolate reductase family protein [Caulobacter sp. S6]QUD86998.1 dihydrofolate reductase family protein [Caulobacter sp. S6]
MRKVIAAAFVSLDGVMQAPGGPEEDPTGGFAQGGWTFGYWDDAMGQFMGETFSRPFDLLLGRKTYEIFAAHWPYADPADPVTERFNAVTKYVATSSPEPLAWANSVSLGANAAAEVARLKQTDGPDLLTQGSSVLLQALFAGDLIDELRLMTFPVILGRGKRVFGSGVKPSGLKLETATTSSTGVVLSVYRPAGEVRTGSFQLAEPSEAELARRERMRREN